MTKESLFRLMHGVYIGGMIACLGTNIVDHPVKTLCLLIPAIVLCNLASE